jgi:hypothetical protein
MHDYFASNLFRPVILFLTLFIFVINKVSMSSKIVNEIVLITFLSLPLLAALVFFTFLGVFITIIIAVKRSGINISFSLLIYNDFAT